MSRKVYPTAWCNSALPDFSAADRQAAEADRLLADRSRRLDLFAARIAQGVFSREEPFSEPVVAWDDKDVYHAIARHARNLIAALDKEEHGEG